MNRKQKTMNPDTVIRFNQVSKQYIKQRLRYGLLSETISQLVAGRRSPVANHNTIQALDNVSFEVKKGETLGIIGPNGAGKSTILKLISKVTIPYAGQVKAIGKIGALIELGAGLHPELTGRENIFLYGAILGMKKKEVASKFKTITDFAEINDFLDMPIKRYSSGMYARLGFSVAVNMDPDILLIDEVLAVGDERFQQKCFKVMDKLKQAGKTIVFVSHNLGWVNRLCRRVIYLSNGKIQFDGQSQVACNKYLKNL